MGTTRLGVFPSLNNKELQDSIAKTVVKWFIMRFPFNFFRNIYIDLQTNVKNNYQVNENGELIGVETGRTIPMPQIAFSFKQGGNNTSDVFGSDIWNVNQQPGAFAIDTDLTGYRPIYYDAYGIIIALNERTIRNQFEVNIKVQTKADQLAVCNYLDSILKMNYVQTIMVDSLLPIHRLMLTYLRSCLFKNEIDGLDYMKADSEEKQKYQYKINKDFMKLLYDSSEGHIKPYKELDQNSNVTNNYTYCYEQTQRVTIHLDKYDADDGNKRGNAWDSFNVSLSGYIEYGNPISFITSVPAIVRGTKNEYFFKMSNDRDENNYIHTIQFKEVYKENRKLLAYDRNLFQHFYFERELLMASVNESFNLIDDIITVEDTPTHYYIARALLSLILNQEQFDNLFKIAIYKNNIPLDKKDYFIDYKGQFTIKNCDLSVPYYIDIFLNKFYYNVLIDKMRNKLKLIKGLDFNEYNSKYNYYKNKRHHNGNSFLIDPLTGKPMIDPFRNIPDNGIGYIPTYYVGDKDDNGFDIEYVPIKQCDFLSIDDAHNYYVYNKENQSFILIKDNNIIFNDEDIKLFIKVNNDFLKIDREKIIIPDKKYKYFIHDKNADKYIIMKDLKKFDILQQYYILKDEYKYNNIIIFERGKSGNLL